MPKVSVILPVYNGEAFLKEAIDSILTQTFRDFELLIMNDGSTDSSEQIILSYTDPRIVYIKNNKNEGLIYTLNKGIDEAKGEYIARMDADDVSLPARLEKQVEYLDANRDTTILASIVTLVDVNGTRINDWKEDVNHISQKEIRHYLMINNCIAHPSVMGRADFFKKYKYKHNQKYSEDYDLWLRLIADKMIIEKLSEPLLQHRILSTSVTRHKKINTFYRVGKVKMRFFKRLISKGKMNPYAINVFAHGLTDFIKGTGKEIKGIFKKE